MQRFRVDLKTSLGLAMPNQYSQTARKQISSWFWEGQNPQVLYDWEGEYPTLYYPVKKHRV